MASNIDKDDSSKFILAAYNDLSQNVMHIESQLFNHMSFFLTLFIGVLTAAGAIVQLTQKTGQPVNLGDSLGLFAFPFLFLCLIGQFEVEMIIQLRVRKIKFIEGIAKSREYFINIDPDLSNYVVLPARLEKAPPYLRVRSEDWFRLIFVISLNALSLLFFWVGLPILIKIILTGFFSPNSSSLFWIIISVLFWVFWLVVGILLCIIYWFTRYERMMDHCSSYDKEREKKMGKPSEYDLLSIPVTKSWAKRSLSDWFLLLEHRRKKNG